MAYSTQTWNVGDKITKEKLDHIEQGIKSVDTKVIPDASTETKGIVKQATKVENVSADDSITISGTSADTELAKLVTLAKELKTKLNAILSALQTSGQMKNS